MKHALALAAPFSLFLLSSCGATGENPYDFPARPPAPARAEQAQGGAAGGQAPSADAATELAKKTQNPVSDLISLPLQSSWNFGIDPGDRTQYVLNVQPVIPFHLDEDWNLITRTIVPVIDQPVGLDDSEFGLGDTTLTLFASPRDSGKLIWGVGPALLLPTASDPVLGTEKWGAGPSAVGLTSSGPWVLGVLANNIWSFAGDEDRAEVNQLLVQPFVNYNLPKGWALSSAPIVTANWKAPEGERWTVPLGGGVAKTFFIGHQAMSANLNAFYNVEHPDAGAEWQIRFQIAFLFPK